MHINHAEGIATTLVHQKVYSDGWYLLGEYRFEKETSGNVALTSSKPRGNNKY